MKILGIETSCDDTCAAAVEATGTFSRPQFRVRSNIVSSQIKIHAAFGGVVPSLAAREHAKNFTPVLKRALRVARSTLNNVDLIAVTTHPGLMPALVVGVHSARTLAWLYKKPIIGVNHLSGHMASILLPPVTKNPKPYTLYPSRFPAVGLIVSGGHTQLVLMHELGNMRVIGETRDDAAGEAFDKIARLLKLPYPGGPSIARCAAQWKSQETRPTSPASEFAGGRARNKKQTNSTSYILHSTFKLPRPMLNSNDLDFSFSGLKTAVLYLLRDAKRDKRRIPLPYLCAEVENAITDVLVAKTIRAAKNHRAKTIFLAGGVAANQTLRKRLTTTLARELPYTIYHMPYAAYTQDNAAMIAAAGFIQWKRMSATQREIATWQRVRIPSF